MKEGGCFAYNFLGVALIALMNCPDRNDYNLPLAVLAYLTWNFTYKSQRHRILWLLLASVLCDMIWILAISIGAWGELQTGNQLRTLTQALSVVNFCYKLGIVIYASVGFEDCKNLFSLDAFKKEVIQLK